MSGQTDLDRWLSIGDLDELLREIDRRCDKNDWNGVQVVGERARKAIERGHQLWPAASYAEYRIALDAPADSAAMAITDQSGYLAPGPLTEVIAQKHKWTDLSPHLPASAKRALVAQERTTRGENVPDADCGDEIPGVLSNWEPGYTLATYSDTGVTDDAPDAHPATTAAPPAESGVESPQAWDASAALHAAVAHWSTKSDGTVRSLGVAGTTANALGSLGLGQLLWRESTVTEYAEILGWAAASGGSQGRRRGAASGRFEVWWTLAVLTAAEDDWPVDPGIEAERLIFGVWAEPAPTAGWECRLTVEDPDDGLAWVLDATDRSE